MDGLCGSCPGVVARGCAEHGGLNPWRRRPCAAAEEGNTERVPRRERGGGGEQEREGDEGGEERVGG